MHAVIKIMLGAAATLVLGAGAHGWLGLGSRYVDGLETKSRTALGNAGGASITIRFDREPALRRIAILSGPADADQQRRLIAAIRAVPGVADARWEAGTAAAAPVTDNGETP